GDQPILYVAVVGDVDAGRVRDEIENVAEARVRKIQPQRLPRRRIQHRLGGRLPGAFAHFLNRRFRTRCLDAITNRPLELGALRYRQTIARVVFGRLLVLAEGGLELIVLLEFTGLVEMRARRGLRRALERDFVVRIVRIGQNGPTVLSDGFVETSGAHGG